jgi:gas vesicle protein
MSDSSGEVGAFFAGFLVGGLVGAGAALLLAPQSGEETRAQIRDRSLELRDKAEVALDDLRAKAEAVVADASRRLEDIRVQSKVVLEEGQKHLAEAVEETKKAAAAAVTSEEAPAKAKAKA